MRENLYVKGEANYPRLKTDKLFADYKNTYDFRGYADSMIRYVEGFQLIDDELWAKCVDQFAKEDADYEGGWRGEYWGKMMRGACFTYSYTGNAKLYSSLEKTVRDMIKTQEADGRISTYGKNHEATSWDLWCRKYVLLGMQYFLEICADDELKNEIITCMKGQVDYLMSIIGPGKKFPDITTCTNNWRGLNSSSILEPVIRLYIITGEKKYLDYSEYIVSCGGTSVMNIFEAAYEDKLRPYEYAQTKAYEMISCFEGLLEYARVTENKMAMQAVINFGTRVLESDFTIIGSTGCTSEMLDHSTYRQCKSDLPDIMAETCVTVTVMKFMYQLTLITGDSKFVDAFEIAMYNAYFGSINTDKVCAPEIVKSHTGSFTESTGIDIKIAPLPFDSYSPLVPGYRGRGIGGFKVMDDGSYYGCCACIGSAGNGLIPKVALMSKVNGFALNLYINGIMSSFTPSGLPVTFMTETKYPDNGKITVTVLCEKSEEYDIDIRIPYWSKNSSITVNREAVEAKQGYTTISRVWNTGDEIEISLDMTVRAVRPIVYDRDVSICKVDWRHDYCLAVCDVQTEDDRKHIAVTRGPIAFALDSAVDGDAYKQYDIKVNEDDSIDVLEADAEKLPKLMQCAVKVPLTDGSYINLIDYASAGKSWSKEKPMAVWMKTV